MTKSTIFGLPLLGLLLTAACFKVSAQSDPKDNAVWKELMQGNERFTNNKAIHPNQNMDRVEATKSGQHPKAVIVTCSDSRVAPEVFFDQGIGDVFVIRTAGNLLSKYDLGSVEYATQHLGTKLVVVVGHTECGVVTAYRKGGKESPHIKGLVKAVKKEKEEKSLNKSGEVALTPYIEANAKHVATQLEKDRKYLLGHAEHGQKAKDDIVILPALYDISTGKVSLIR